MYRKGNLDFTRSRRKNSTLPAAFVAVSCADNNKGVVAVIEGSNSNHPPYRQQYLLNQQSNDNSSNSNSMTRSDKNTSLATGTTSSKTSTTSGVSGSNTHNNNTTNNNNNNNNNNRLDQKWNAGLAVSRPNDVRSNRPLSPNQQRNVATRSPGSSPHPSPPPPLSSSSPNKMAVSSSPSSTSTIGNRSVETRDFDKLISRNMSNVVMKKDQASLAFLSPPITVSVRPFNETTNESEMSNSLNNGSSSNFGNRNISPKNQSSPFDGSNSHGSRESQMQPAKLSDEEYIAKVIEEIVSSERIYVNSLISVVEVVSSFILVCSAITFHS